MIIDVVFKRWLFFTVLTVALCLGASVGWSALQERPPSTTMSPPDGPVIVVSVSGLTFDDSAGARRSVVWDLARDGAVGAMATRSMSQHSCTPQSWLSFSAGNRTSLFKNVPATPPGKTPERCASTPYLRIMDDGSAYFANWWWWRETTLARSSPGDIGRLASTVGAAGDGRCVQAAGEPAALGAADRQGVIDRFAYYPQHLVLSDCELTLISLDSPHEPTLRWIVDHAPKNATLVIGGFGDDEGPERFHPVVINGPGVDHGLLTSAATRQQGVVLLTDLSAWTLSRADLPQTHLPEARVPQVQPTSSPTAPIVHTGEKIRTLWHQGAVIVPFVVTFYVLAALLLVGGWWKSRRATSDRERTRWLTGVALVAASTACMPASTFLVNVLPWWRSDHPRLLLCCLILAIAVTAGGVALVGPWRRWLGGSTATVALFTAATVGLDVTHNSELQFVSILGLQPVYGGRFYGMGNVAYAWFAASALLFAALVANPLLRTKHRWNILGAFTVLLIGGAAVVIDGYPSWGADGGGPLALAPAVLYLVANTLGWRLTWGRMIAMVVGSGVVVLGLAALDYSRGPAHRTHLGDVFAQVWRDQNFSRFNRIWQANLNMLTGSFFSMLVPLLIAVVIYAQVRRTSRLGQQLEPIYDVLPILRNGFAAVTVCLCFATLLNDSGTGIVPSGLMIVLPLIVMQRARLASASEEWKERAAAAVRPRRQADTP